MSKVQDFGNFDLSSMTVLCLLSKILYPLLSTGLTQEDRKLSQYDGMIVDWDLKHELKVRKSVFAF